MPVSLFYHYVDISDTNCLAQRLIDYAVGQNLAGRIRVSSEGINGTFGGSQSEVEAFHSFLLEELKPANVDFKVAEGSAENFPEGWKVRICQELVTMGVPPHVAGWREAAPHVEPGQFRSEVLQALQEGSDQLVVLDVRNQYEHAIGRFKGAVLPSIRQFSDFPKFVHENAYVFRNKRVLMYCTGGIRCERASAYLKSTGEPASVGQLHGGIDRFLKTFPCGGGAFEGKNLVFDTRMAVSTCVPTTVGKCISCQCMWDDYSSNRRCCYCRSRVLICDNELCSSEFYYQGMGICSICKQRERKSSLRIENKVDVNVR